MTGLVAIGNVTITHRQGIPLIFCVTGANHFL